MNTKQLTKEMSSPQSEGDLPQRDERFLNWLRGFVIWYNKSSSRWSFLLICCRLLTLAGSLATIVVASASNQDFLATTGKWLLVASATLTAFSSELLGQFRVREREELRETGNIEMEALEAYAEQKLEQYSGNPQRIYALKDEIREKVFSIELKQHRQDVDINMGRDGLGKKPPQQK